MLELVTGNIREGKTASIVHGAYFVHLQNLVLNERVPFYKWCPIYSNFKIKYEEVQEVEVGDLLELEGITRGYLALDEGYTWLESRVSASKLNRYVSYFIFQSGKRDVDVAVTAQLGSSIDLRFCELAHVQRLAYKDVVNGVFHYKTGCRVGLGVRVSTWDMKFEDFAKFWDDYTTEEPVKPLGLEELQVEMDKFNVGKINRRVDDLVEVMLDDAVRSAMGWYDAKFVFRYQVEDLLLRWGKPLLLAPLVVNRLKCVLRG